MNEPWTVTIAFLAGLILGPFAFYGVMAVAIKAYARWKGVDYVKRGIKESQERGIENLLGDDEK